MGCDIHAMIERRQDNGGTYVEWLNTGDPAIGRNYEMFAVLAGVRNYDDIVPIAEPRGLPTHEPACFEMQYESERYGVDGHSHSWLTLAEIKAYDTTQTVDDGSLIVGTDKAGAITATCRWSSAPTLGPVGMRRVLHWHGEDEPTSWLRLIRYMEAAKWDGQSDDEIRLVFFFDN